MLDGRGVSRQTKHLSARVLLNFKKWVELMIENKGPNVELKLMENDIHNVIWGSNVLVFWSYSSPTGTKISGGIVSSSVLNKQSFGNRRWSLRFSDGILPRSVQEPAVLNVPLLVNGIIQTIGQPIRPIADAESHGRNPRIMFEFIPYHPVCAFQTIIDRIISSLLSPRSSHRSVRWYPESPAPNSRFPLICALHGCRNRYHLRPYRTGFQIDFVPLLSHVNA